MLSREANPVSEELEDANERFTICINSAAFAGLVNPYVALPPVTVSVTCALSITKVFAPEGPATSV